MFSSAKDFVNLSVILPCTFHWIHVVGSRHEVVNTMFKSLSRPFRVSKSLRFVLVQTENTGKTTGLGN